MQEMNIKKLSSVKIIVIALLIISVIVFGSLSWFTMSKEVEGSGTQMTASDLPFELEVRGTKIENQSIFSKIDNNFISGVQQKMAREHLYHIIKLQGMKHMEQYYGTRMQVRMETIQTD